MVFDFINEKLLGLFNRKLPIVKKSSTCSEEIVKKSSSSHTQQGYKLLRAIRRSTLNLITLLGIFFITTIIISSVLKKFEGSEVSICQQIYMYPLYARIDGFDTRYSKFAQKYRLYLYREQAKDTRPEKDNEIHLHGIPVLFIPGNAGSYKQVRSIAAAAADLYFGDDRDFIKNDKVKNLDFFTADFNEDLTAFRGKTMLDQAKFCNDAIKYILDLYSRSRGYKDLEEPLPTSVILVGHSMGGVVARLMTVLKNHEPYSVNSIITLSSPHLTAPLSSDRDILKIYSYINNAWRDQFRDENSFYSKNITVISFTGGILDTVLPADYTAIETIVPPSNGFTIYTTSIPNIWASIDHLAIVWCDQLRKVVAKLIFNMVDYSVPSKTYPRDTRMDVARRYLLSGFHEKLVQNYILNMYQKEPIRNINIDSNLNRIGPNIPLIIDNMSYSEIPRYNLFEITEDLFTFSFLSTSDKIVIFACNSTQTGKNSAITTDFNTKCRDISAYMSTIPASYKKNKISEQMNTPKTFKFINIDPKTLFEFSFIVVQKPEKEFVKDYDFFIAETSSKASIKTYKIDLLKMLFKNFIFHYNSSESLFFSTILFPNQWSSLISYHILANFENTNMIFEPYIVQSINQPYENKWHFFLKKGFDISFHSEAPFIPFTQMCAHPLTLSIFAPPFTDIEFTLSINWLLTFKLLFLRYRLAIVCFPISLISLVLGYQFFIYNEGGYLSGFDYFLSLLVRKHWKLLFFTSFILSLVSSLPIFQKLLFLLDPVGLNDPLFLKDKNVTGNAYYFGIRDAFMACLGPFILTMTIATVHLMFKLIQFLGLISIFLYKSLFSIFGRSKLIRSYLILDSNINRHMCLRQVVGAIILTISVIIYIPYQFGFILVFLVQFSTCMKLAILNRNTRDYTELKNYNYSLLLLMLFISFINLPIVIVFFHDLSILWEVPFGSHHDCLAILPVIMLIINNANFKLPIKLLKNRYIGRFTACKFLYLALYSLFYGIRNLYFVHHLFVVISAWLYFTSLASLFYDV